MLRRKRHSTEIERITSKHYGLFRAIRYVGVLIFVWIFFFAVYMTSIKFVEFVYPWTFYGLNEEPLNYFMIAYGIGAILATLVTALESFELTVEELDAYIRDRGLVRAFLKVASIRDARRKLRASETSVNGEQKDV